MGELIKKLDELRIGNTKFDIELNEPTNGTEMRDIHIQNDKFRISIPEDEFLQMLACIIMAEKQLNLIKKGE